MSCGCEHNAEVFSSNTEEEKKKGYLNIEGFTNMKKDTGDVQNFKKNYKKYLESQHKINLDENAKRFYENFDSTTENILSKNRENKELREELDGKMKEFYKTLQSQNYETEKIANMYKVRDLILYSISAVVLYYIFVEL